MNCRHCHGEHDVERHKKGRQIHESGKDCDLCQQTSHAEHLAWCKKRALAYLPANPVEAVVSMQCDLPKHPDWRDPIGLVLLMSGEDHCQTPQRARAWIEGWN